MDEYRPRITDLPNDERPRERLLHVGASAVSTVELLAIILRVGTGGENVMRAGAAAAGQIQRAGRAGPRFDLRIVRGKGIGRSQSRAAQSRV